MDISGYSNLNIHSTDNIESSGVSIAHSAEPQVSEFNASQDAIQLQGLLPGDRSPPLGTSKASKAKISWNKSLDRFRSALTIFLRNIRLLALPVVGSWTRKREKPKTAIHKSRSIALLGLTVHIIPLANALSLVFLNWMTLYVGTDVPSTALQFLAKFLELLTQASISNAFLVYLRHGLTGDGVLPFGALFAGLQVTSISYLWSLEFFGTVASRHISVPRRLLFMSFVTFNILLASGIGPSIAIALIPRRQMYPAGMTYIWLNNTLDMFSSRMTSKNVPPECNERTSKAAVLYMCPYSGWESFLDYKNFSEGVTLNYRRFQDPYLNRQILSWFDGYPDQTIPKMIDPTISNGTGSTTPSLSMSFLNILGKEILFGEYGDITPKKILKHKYGILSTIQAKQPAAWVYCAITAWPMDNVTNFRDPDHGYDRYRTLSSPDLNKLSQNSSSSQIVWIETESSARMSIFALVVTPSFCGGNSVNACSIFAGWSNSTISTYSNSVLGSTVTGNITSLPDHTVKFSKEWAELLLPTLDNETEHVYDSLTVAGDLESKMTEMILGGIITSAMSHGGYFFDSSNELVIQGEELINYSLIGSKDWTDPWLAGKDHNLFRANQSQKEGHYRVKSETFVDGIAYTMDGTPKKLAIVVLITYCIYIITFIIYILGFSGVQSSAWDSISELTALAMLSKPPREKLRNTSAGIETVELFKEPVNIRAVGDDHLEIVFKNDEDARAMDKVEFNKEY